jgi:predicted Rossmann fold nucleotide-binding protein DprA/Smf involved in DNA uptake
MNNTEHQLSPDTQAILLLCGHFGKKTSKEIKPLTPSEYAWLAQWLQSQEMRPADLLEPGATIKIKHIAYKNITGGRLLSLLMRGGALALAVETWTNKGLWIISRSDSAYPVRLKKQLRQAAPPIFYGIGQQTLLQKGGLAVVGSREVDKQITDFTKLISKKSAQQQICIISGGARGVDTEAMVTALIHGGTTIGVLADSLVRTAVASQYRDALREERLVLITPFDPDARFHVGNAMARNKYVYALADWAMVVNSGYQEGGTWAGATENLKARWVPLFVRNGESLPTGNKELLNQGAIGLDIKTLQNMTDLRQQLAQLIENKPLQITEEAPDTYHQVGEGTTEEEQPLEKDLFEAVWPHFELQLVTEKTEKELAECLDIYPKQLKIWLKRALDTGKIKKLKKPVRYINADADEKVQQKSLFG